MQREFIQIHIKMREPHRNQIEAVPLKMKQADRYGYIRIADGDWDKFNIPHFCSQIQQWYIERSIWLNRNQKSTIIKQLALIGFPTLQELYIAENKIQSIEAVSLLHAPQLMVLWMAKNFINSLKPLSKAFLPKLSYLRFNENYVWDVSPLCKTHMKVVNQINIEMNKFSQSQCFDLSPFAKFQPTCDKSIESQDQRIFFLYVFGWDRIRQEALLSALNHKFQKIQVGRTTNE